MYKNKATGYYEDDFRRGGIRLHLSYGVTKKDDATPLHAAVLAQVKAKNTPVLEALRDGRMSANQIARLMAEGKPVVLPADAVAPVASLSDAAWPSVTDAVDQYLAWIATNPKKSDGTHTAATTQLNRFLEWLGEDAALPLDQITTKRVTAYQASLYADGMAQNTVVAYVWRAGGVFRWHRDSELRDAQEEKRVARMLHVPLDPTSVATDTTSRDRWLTEAEAERLLAACPDRLLCPVAIGLFAGLRVDEVMHLRTAFDIDLEAGLLIVQPQPGTTRRKAWNPKNKKRRFVPIATPLRPLLEAHLARFASEDWLNPSLRDAKLAFNRHTFDGHFRQIVGDAELVQGRSDPEGVVFHTLRHTFASWLIARGVDLYTVAQLLGNSLKRVEDTYGHLAPDFKRAAVDRLVGAVAVPTYPELPQTDTPDWTPESGTEPVWESATETATTEAV